MNRGLDRGDGGRLRTVRNEPGRIARVGGALVVALLLSACGESATSDGADMAGGQAQCTPPNQKTDRGTVNIVRIFAGFADPMGQPFAGIPASVVGLDIASPVVTSGADGMVDINFKQSVKAPVFRFGDGVRYPTLVLPLDTGMKGFAGLPTAALPASGKALTAGTSVTSGGATLDIVVSATIGIDTLSFDTPDKQVFRSVTLPLGAGFHLDTHNLGIGMMVGMAPAETTFCPPASLTLENRLMWPAGTVVELYRLGNDVGEAFSPFGDWYKVGEGTVTRDGQSIFFARMVAALGTFGVRQKP